MKIGFDAKRAVSNFTGLGNYSRFVILNLMKFYPDNAYRLFAPEYPSVTAGALTSEKRHYRVRSTRMPFWRTLGIVKDIKHEKLDIYHGLSNELPLGINGAAAKSIVTIHDLIFLRYPQFYKKIDRRIYNFKAEYACKVADRIIAVSECTKRDIVELYGIDPGKISVVYQGCFPVFKTKADERFRENVRKTYGLPARYMLSLGSIEQRKNVMLIVKAMKQVPDIHFVAIGKQKEYAAKVLEYAAANGLAHRVHFLTKVPLTDLPAILQQAEMFIYPSLYEGFGIPVIEALSSGVPVIAAKGSCLEEAGGPDTIYVDPHDENELAAQIKRLLSDDGLRRRMVERGLEYVGRFSDEKCTEAIMEVYNSVTAQ